MLFRNVAKWLGGKENFMVGIILVKVIRYLPKKFKLFGGVCLQVACGSFNFWGKEEI